MTGLGGAIRAELFVLVRRKVVWALVLLTPVLTVVGEYLDPYLLYRGDTPDRFQDLGTPSQLLSDLLPDQYVAKALSSFGNGLGVAPFVLLGVIVAGSDWERGTVRTALGQTAGRLRWLSGQMGALTAAVVASTAATFGAAFAAAVLVRGGGPGATGLVETSFPSLGTVLSGFAVAALIATTFGIAGLLLGTCVRSVGPAVAAALGYFVVVAPFLDNLGYQVRPLTFLTFALPDTSGLLLTGLYYPGEDAAANYPVSAAAIAAILVGWAVVFLTVLALVVVRRDITGERVPKNRRDRSPSSRRRPAGGALRAEVFVLWRWPIARVLLLVTPGYAILNSYVLQVIFALTANSGTFADLSPDDIRDSLRPAHFAAVALGNIGDGATFNGAVPVLLLGALTAGASWAGGTTRTAFLQRTGRTRTMIAQSFAVVLAVAAGVLITFVICGLSSVVAGWALNREVGPWPSIGALGTAFGAGLLVSTVYAAIGLALGGLLRNAGAAAAVVLLWTIVLAPLIGDLAPQLRGPVRAVYSALPDAGSYTLIHLLDPVTTRGPKAGPATAVAIIVLGCYLAASLAVPLVINRRRDAV